MLMLVLLSIRMIGGSMFLYVCTVSITVSYLKVCKMMIKLMFIVCIMFVKFFFDCGRLKIECVMFMM